MKIVHDRRKMKVESRRVNAREMRSLRSMCKVSSKAICENSDVRKWCGLKVGIVIEKKEVRRPVCCDMLFSWLHRLRILFRTDMLMGTREEFSEPFCQALDIHSDSAQKSLRGVVLNSDSILVCDDITKRDSYISFDILSGLRKLDKKGL
ncbi:hypothetical protein EVAR_31238_1 [Eumeta japonica]|uniref:Uncharacterized protein n=1 Tax=Eumeta variegata TaxID=151549 RepID=A0A4C1VZV1_EUMVA|nr:hypothetical protein EVAR_31238_1 [Eumeta japonica]